MRYYVTANSPGDKRSLLATLTNVIDDEPGSHRNILIDEVDLDQLKNDPRVKNVQPHPDDWPGYELKLFAE